MYSGVCSIGAMQCMCCVRDLREVALLFNYISSLPTQLCAVHSHPLVCVQFLTNDTTWWNECLIVVCTCWSWRIVSEVTTWGVWWMGLPHCPRTWWRLSNQRQSVPFLPKDLWNGKVEERKVMPSGVEPRVSGLSCQHSATEPWHLPTATPPSSPLITLLLVIIDEMSVTTILFFPLLFQIIFRFSSYLTYTLVCC